MPYRGCSQRTGGWCEPGGGGMAAGAGAGCPKELFPVGRHGFASVIRAGTCWSPVERTPEGREAGWYRGKGKFIVPGAEFCSRDVFCCPERSSSGPEHTTKNEKQTHKNHKKLKKTDKKKKTHKKKKNQQKKKKKTKQTNQI